MSYQDRVLPSQAPRTAAVVSSIKVMDSVDSTNSLLSRALMLGDHSDAQALIGGLFSEGHDVAAYSPSSDGLAMSLATSDVQTQCRGRLGRSWSNRPGESFMASWAVPVPRPILLGRHVGWLTMTAGLALLEALRDVLAECGARLLHEDSAISLKWPNDLFINGRKLGGILSEMVEVNEQWSAVLFGVGINMFMSRADLPIDLATSLQLEYAPLPGYEELRDRIAAAASVKLRDRLEHLYADPDGVCHALLIELSRESWTIGRSVKANLASGEVVLGRALRIDDDASLVVLCHDGVERTVTTGDVGVLPE
ncbi:biotin-(acetyl-CoA carboxylase) ligase [Bifidobacterium psychraerophilum]|uniref:biotin--[biotin carboxyl-carrier protein] ligase n=1 Tax=Bifidobacterium psychraerophilum TaxID=218140 RepID=A0A087CFP0_9BIFI|nr:biotin-(acetyl-CoA carboxylase) ligase [Bifidobacterium psychraerophilum]